MSIRPRIWTLRKQGEHSAAERVLLGDGWDKVSFHRPLTAPSPYWTVALLDCCLTGPLGFCSWPAVTAPLTTAEEIPYCVLYSFPRTPRTKETVAWLKQQKFIHLQFGSLRVWEIWESEKSMLSLKALEEGPSVPLPHFQWLPAILAASSFQSRSLLS